MLRATRGALADSIFLYATWMNVALVLLTLGAAAVLPSLLRRVPTQLRIPAVVVALVVGALDPAARSRVDTIGLERNIVVALATSVLPRVDAQRAAADWVAPFEEHETDDLYLPIAGHHPYETPAPGPFPDREEFGRYRNALRYADESVGAFVSALPAPPRWSLEVHVRVGVTSVEAL
jgi:hypothetical protein